MGLMGVPLSYMSREVDCFVYGTALLVICPGSPILHEVDSVWGGMAGDPGFVGEIGFVQGSALCQVEVCCDIAL